MAFEIGDKVIVKLGKGRSEHGTVYEVLKGRATDICLYGVTLESKEQVWVKPENIAPVHLEQVFTFEVDIPSENNIVIVKMMANGNEIARGHGHLIHAGAEGIAQAMSYACKRIWNDLKFGEAMEIPSEKTASATQSRKPLRDISVNDLDISARAKAALIRNGILDLNTCINMGPDRLRQLRGIGNGIVAEVADAIRELTENI